MSCFNDATCTDVPAPGTGATCPPCPPGFTGDNGLVCNGKWPLLAFQGIKNFRKKQFQLGYEVLIFLK